MRGCGAGDPDTVNIHSQQANCSRRRKHSCNCGRRYSYGHRNNNARFVRPVAENIANRLLFRQPEMYITARTLDTILDISSTETSSKVYKLSHILLTMIGGGALSIFFRILSIFEWTKLAKLVAVCDDGTSDGIIQL